MYMTQKLEKAIYFLLENANPSTHRTKSIYWGNTTI